MCTFITWQHRLRLAFKQLRKRMEEFRLKDGIEMNKTMRFQLLLI